MKDIIIARRYADGYLDYCRETIGVKRGLEQFLRFRDILEKVPELHQFLRGAIGHEEKRAFIDGVLRREFAGEFCDFMELLLEKQRIARLEDIAEYAVSAYLHEEQHVILETVNMMDIAQLKRLKAALEKKLGTAVRIYMHFNADLIGGFRVRIGNTVIDGSVSRWMSDLRGKLKNIGMGRNELPG